MIISLVLTLLVTTSGTIATYLYDEAASFAARLCAGACIGLTTLGLVCFVLASLLGLSGITIAISAVILSLPFLLLLNQKRRSELRSDLHNVKLALQRNVRNPSYTALGYALFYFAVAFVIWRVFDRAMIETPEGIATGVLNNFGDLPFHLSVITGFAYGNNFPPEDPTFAGVRFTYPFLTDFISAIFVRCGASLRQSMFLENFVVAMSFVGLIHRWAIHLLKDRLAAIATPLIAILNGGFGWILLWEEAKKSETGIIGALKALPPSVTVIPETTWRWGNAVACLLVPQRGMLLGLPLAVIVFTQWWLSEEKGEEGKGEEGKEEAGKRGRRESGKAQKGNVGPGSSPISQSSLNPFPASYYRMIAAGFIAGLLPLVHAHSFIAVMTVGAVMALLQRRWQAWFYFFLFASLVAVPQMLWSTHNSAVDAKSFIDVHFGWDRGEANTALFWLKNTSVFIPLLALAIFWRGKDYLVSKRLLVYYLPFTLCFIIPNLIKLAPWVWDNIKVLYYWWLASSPLVALLLARLWRRSGVARVAALALFVCLTLAGTLDVMSIMIRSTNFGMFDARGVQFAELIKQQTEPRSLIVHAPVHNHPIFLTGRKSLMGYPGHIWTHGLEFAPREGEIKRIYAGAPDAEQLLRKYGAEYVVISPLERNVVSVNDQFFTRFRKVGEVGEYRLYKTQP